MLRFLPKIEWPGRVIRSGEGPVRKAAPAPEAPAAVGADLLTPEHQQRVRRALDEARRDLATLRNEAEAELEEALHIDVSERPSIRAAVELLSGTHPDYGTLRPEVPPSHRIAGTAEINAPVYKRAASVLEHADRIMYGFDVRDVARAEYEGKVQTYGPITSPAVAAGEVPPAPQGLKPIEAAVDEKLFMTKREIFYMIFLSIMSFLCYFIADLFDGIARTVRNMFSVKILRWRIGIGKFVSWPFRQLASLFRQWGRWFEEKAMQQQPRAPEAPVTPEPEPPPSDYLAPLEAGQAPDDDLGAFAETFPAEGVDVLFAEVEASPSWKLDTPRYDGSGGLAFLMAAQQVASAAWQHAEDPGQESLHAALRRYHASREGDLLYDIHRDVARQIGVPVEDLTLEFDPAATGPREAAPQLPRPETHDSPPETPFTC